MPDPKPRIWLLPNYLSRKWLQVLPTQKSNILADPEAIEAIRSRLLIPARPVNLPCSFCGALASLGHEDSCKSADRRYIARHDQITRAFTKALASRASLEAQAEKPDIEGSSKRADFSINLNNSRYFYDIQVVAINKASAKNSPHETLTEAAHRKIRKYSELGSYFRPLIFSAAGLLEKSTASYYKEIQQLIRPIMASWLDAQLGLILTKTRAQSAVSIASKMPRPSEASWAATRAQLAAARTS